MGQVKRENLAEGGECPTSSQIRTSYGVDGGCPTVVPMKRGRRARTPEDRPESGVQAPVGQRGVGKWDSIALKGLFQIRIKAGACGTSMCRSVGQAVRQRGAPRYERPKYKKNRKARILYIL